MRLVCISDQHGYLPEIERCDLLLVGGDITPATNHRLPFQRDWLDTSFRSWLERTKATRIVGVAGNHDFAFQEDPERLPRGLRWDYLNESSTEIEGIKIWGSPWQLYFGGWAFNAPQVEGETFLDIVYSKVPEGTDVVITHGPPANCGDVDLVPKNLPGSPNAGVHVGSHSLTKHLKRVKPRYCICGHIHSGYGRYQTEWGTIVINASYLNENYRPAHQPVVIEW